MNSLGSDLEARTAVKCAVRNNRSARPNFSSTRGPSYIYHPICSMAWDCLTCRQRAKKSNLFNLQYLFLGEEKYSFIISKINCLEPKSFTCRATWTYIPRQLLYVFHKSCNVGSVNIRKAVLFFWEAFFMFKQSSMTSNGAKHADLNLCSSISCLSMLQNLQSLLYDSACQRKRSLYRFFRYRICTDEDGDILPIANALFIDRTLFFFQNIFTGSTGRQLGTNL